MSTNAKPSTRATKTPAAQPGGPTPAPAPTQSAAPAQTPTPAPADPKVESATEQTPSAAEAIERRAAQDTERREQTQAKARAEYEDQRARAAKARAEYEREEAEAARLEAIAQGIGAIPTPEPVKPRTNGQIIAGHWLAALSDAGALERGVCGGAIEALVDADGSDGDPLALACSAEEDEKHSKSGARLLKDARGAAGKGARGAAIGRALAAIVAAAFRESAAIRADADLPAQSRTVREAIQKAQITDAD